MRSDRRGFLGTVLGIFGGAIAALKGEPKGITTMGELAALEPLSFAPRVVAVPAPGYVIVHAGEPLQMGEMVRFKDGKAYRWSEDKQHRPIGQVIDAEQEFPNVVISLDTYPPQGGYALQVWPDGSVRDSWRNVWP